jgi:hypothetical protein
MTVRIPLLRVGAAFSVVAFLAGCSRSGVDDASPDADVTSVSAPIAEGGSAEPAPSSVAQTAQSVTERWWNWQGAFAEDVNPVSDSSGVDCGNGQPDDVWFVAGTFGNQPGDVTQRTCTVPAGRVLVGPVLNTFYDPASAATMSPTVASQVQLDGKPVTFREERVDQFSLRTVEGNPIASGYSGIVGGHGFWFETPPLTPGVHTLTIVGVEASGFRVDVRYDITAK